MITFALFLITMGTIAGLIGAVVIWILSIVGYWKVFEKAGVAGWKCLIPFYNEFTAYGIAWKPYFYIILFVANAVANYLNTLDPRTMLMSAIITIFGIVTTIIQIIYSIRMSKSFGHGIGFAIGLLILPSIFTIILGFGSSTYKGQPDTLV